MTLSEKLKAIQAEIREKYAKQKETEAEAAVHWAIVRLQQKASFGWTNGRQCTNIQTGSPNGGAPRSHSPETSASGP